MPPDVMIWSTLFSSNYLCLEHILMVPKVFEPLMFYCIEYFRSFVENHIREVHKGQLIIVTEVVDEDAMNLGWYTIFFRL